MCTLIVAGLVKLIAVCRRCYPSRLLSTRLAQGSPLLLWALLLFAIPTLQAQVFNIEGGTSGTFSVQSGTYLIRGPYNISGAILTIAGTAQFGTSISGNYVSGDGTPINLQGNNKVNFTGSSSRLVLLTTLNSSGDSNIISAGGLLGLYTFKNPNEINVSSGELTINSPVDGWYFGGFHKEGMGVMTLGSMDDNEVYYAGINSGTVRVTQSASLSVGSLFGTPQGTLLIDSGGTLSASVSSNFTGKLAGGGWFVVYGRALAAAGQSPFEYVYSDVPMPQNIISLSGDLSRFTGTLALGMGTLSLNSSISDKNIQGVLFANNSNATLVLNGAMLRTSGLNTGWPVYDTNVARYFDGSYGNKQVIAAGISSGTLRVDLAAGQTNRFDGTFQDGGGSLSLEKFGAGRLVLGGTLRNTNSFTTVAGGVLQFLTNNTVKNLFLTVGDDGGGIEIAAGKTLDLRGTIFSDNHDASNYYDATISGGSLNFFYATTRIGVTGTNLIISSALLGGGAIVKSGTGSLTLSQSIPFTTITINGGSLVVGGSGSLNRDSELVMNGGSLLIKNALNQRVETLTVSSGSSFTTTGGGEFKVGSDLTLNASSRLNITSTGSQFVFTDIVGSGGTINVFPGAFMNGDANNRLYGAGIGAHTINLMGGELRDANLDSGATLNLGVSGFSSYAEIAMNAVLARSNVAKLLSPVNVNVSYEDENGVRSFQKAGVGGLSGNFNFKKSGLGYFVVLGASPQFSGDVSVDAGTLFATDILKGTRSVTVSSNAMLVDTRSANGSFSGTLSGAGSVQIMSESFTGVDDATNLIFLPGPAVTLTLGTSARISTTLEVGDNVTLSVADAVNSLPTGASVAVGRGGRIDLDGSGAMAGKLTGSGTLSKIGNGSLVLTDMGGFTGQTGVLSGTLSAANILSGSRGVAISSGATLTTSVNSGTYSGSLRNDGLVNLSITGDKLVLSPTSPLSGTVNLLTGALDAQQPGSSFLNNGSLNIGATGILILGGSSQELELTAISLSAGARIQGSGARIYYDALPSFLNENNQVVIGANNITGVTFDVLTKGGTIAGTGSVSVPHSYDYRFTAGRIAPRDKSLLWGGTLFLEPEKPTSNLRILSPGTLTTGIVASGTGFVTIGTMVTSPRLTIGSSIAATITQEGSLSATGGARIVNNGTLLLSVVSGAKTVDSLIEGSGIVRKLDNGSLTLSNGLSTANGNLFVDGGVLTTASLPGGSSSGVTVNGGELSLSASASTGTLSLASGFISGVTGSVLTSQTGFVLQSGSVSVSLSGQILKTSSGTVVLNSQNNGNGSAVVVDGGVLRLGKDDAFSASTPQLTVSGGELALDGTRQNIQSVVNLAGGQINGGTLISALYALQSGTVSSAMFGAGDVVKTGFGTVVLLGANALSGKMQIDAGTLALGGTSTLTSGNVVMNGGNLALNDKSQRVGSFAISSGSAFTKAGSGVLKADTLRLGAGSTLNVQSGTFVFGETAGSAGTINILASGTLNGDRNGRADGAPIRQQTVNFLGGGLTDADIGTDVSLNFGSSLSSGTALLGFGMNRIQATAVLKQAVNLLVLGDTTIQGISGSYAVTKSGEGALTVASDSASYTGPVTVSAGSLTATNLLAGSRPVNVTAAGTLNLTLTGGTTYSGVMSGSGRVLITNNLPITLSLGAGGKLDGSFSFLSQGLTLDTTAGATNVFGDNARLNFTNGGSLVIGNTQQLELQSIALQSGILTLTSNGGQILYDQQPSFLTSDGSLISGQGVVVNGTVSFDVLTKGGLVSDGTYQYIAGKVRDKSLATGAMLAGSVLKLDPMRPTTKIRLSDAASFSREVIAGGSLAQGSVSFESILYTPLVTISPGVSVTLAEGGTLQVGSGDATPSRVVNNGSLIVSVDATAKKVSNVISGTGSLEKLGSSLLKLAGVNTYSGGTTLSAGGLQMENASALGSGTITFNGGTFVYDNDAVVDVSARINRVGTGKKISVDTNSNDVVFGSALKGEGGLYKTGNGTLVLAADDSELLGQIIVNAGTLQVGSTSLPGKIGGNVTVSANAMMRLANNSNTDLAQVISGAGTVEKTGTGKVTLSGDNSQFSGGVILKNGTLNVASASALGGAGTITFAGGVLQFSSANNVDYSARISSASLQAMRIDTNGANVRFDSVFGGSGDSTLVKSGDGTLTLSRDNGFTGLTSVYGGTLAFEGAQSGKSALNLIAGRAVFVLSDSQAVATRISTSQSTETAFQVAAGGMATFTGTINGTGSVTKSGAGKLSLGGQFANSGGVSVGAGTLELLNQTTLQGAVSVAAGAVLDLVNGGFNASTALTLTGSLRLGPSNVFIQKLTLNSGGTISLVSDDADAGARIWVAEAPIGTLSNGLLSSGGVEIARFTQGTANSPAVVTGSLSGNVSGLPTGTSLNLQANSKGKPVSLVGTDLQLSELNADRGVDLRIGIPVSVSKTFGVSGGSISLSNGANVSAAQVAINNASIMVLMGTSALNSKTSVDVGANSTVELSGSSEIAATALTVSGSSTVTVNNLTALQKVGVLEIGSAAKTGGTLKVASGTLTLGSGATSQVLKGSGKIVGNINVSNGSVVSPGNSPGTLTITGSLSLANGTSLVLEYGGTRDGQDILQGGTVNFDQGSIIKVVDYNRSLTSGTAKYSPFGNLTVNGSLNANIVVALRTSSVAGTTGDDGVAYANVYSAALSGTYSSGTISVTRQSLQSLGSFTGNIQKMAAAVNARQLSLASLQSGSGSFSPNAIDEIGSSSVSPVAAKANLFAQLAAANPAAYAELPGLSFHRTLNLGQGIFDHFASVRGRVDQVEGRDLGFWSTTYGSWMKQNGDASNGTSGFSGNTWGDAFGVEHRYGSLLLGLMGAAGQTSANFSISHGSITTDSWHGGGYASLDLSQTFLEAGVLYGNTDSRVRRTVSGIGLTANEGKLSISGSEWLLHLGVSHVFEASRSITVTPSTRLLLQGESLEAANESSMNGLEISTIKQRSYRVSQQTGVEVTQNFKLASLPSQAALRTQWIHRFDTNGKTLDMQFGDDTSTRARYQGSTIGADAIRIGSSLESRIGTRTSVRFSVDYQSQNNASSTYSGFTIGYKF